jgi:hypothetical protein
MLYKKNEQSTLWSVNDGATGNPLETRRARFWPKDQISGINKASLVLEIPLIWPFLPENHQKPATVLRFLAGLRLLHY